MNASRVIAIVLVIGAALWIGSGMFVDGNGEAENAATAQNGQGTPKSADGTTKESKNSQDPLPSVRVMTSKAERHDDFLRVSGQTEAVIKADIRAETSARVIEIDVEKGQRVKKRRRSGAPCRRRSPGASGKGQGLGGTARIAI
jgi:multidrug efflux system membrane fusion protein